MGHIHSNEQFDFTVSGYLVHDGKTLLIKHKKLPMWTPPSGHIELNETPIEALYKEIYEEAGIDASHLTLIEPHLETKSLERGPRSTYLPLPFDTEWHYVGEDGHRHIDFAYMLVSDTAEVKPAEGESQTFAWYTADELATLDIAPASILRLGAYAINYIQEYQS